MILLRPFPDPLHILHTHNLHNQGLLDGKATLNLDELWEKALLNLLMMDGAHLKKRNKNHGLMNAKKMGRPFCLLFLSTLYPGNLFESQMCWLAFAYIRGNYIEKFLVKL